MFAENPELQQQERIPEGISQPDLDFLIEHWATLAAIAHNGFLEVGRGTLLVQIDRRKPSARYRPGPPCDCHQEVTDKYDPHRHVVFVIRRRGGDESVALIGGLPTPADCFTNLAATLFAEQMQ